MTGAALDDGPGGIDLETLRPQRHRLIKPDATPEPRRLADHDAGAVIDEEALTDLGAGMDVDPGLGMGEFRDNAGHQRRAQQIKPMGDAMTDDGRDPRSEERRVGKEGRARRAPDE